MSPDDEKPLELDVEERGRATIVRIIGSAGMNEAEGLRRDLEQIASRAIPVIVLDLSDMEFISSLGLGAIISAHLKCRHHAGQAGFEGLPHQRYQGLLQPRVEPDDDRTHYHQAVINEINGQV